jgi:hypothetical protein
LEALVGALEVTWRIVCGFGINSAFADECAQSDPDNLLRWIEFWCLRTGCAITPAGIREIESRGCTMTVLLQLSFFYIGTLLV